MFIFKHTKENIIAYNLMKNKKKHTIYNIYKTYYIYVYISCEYRTVFHVITYKYRTVFIIISYDYEFWYIIMIWLSNSAVILEELMYSQK